MTAGISAMSSGKSRQAVAPERLARVTNPRSAKLKRATTVDDFARASNASAQEGSNVGRSQTVIMPAGKSSGLLALFTKNPADSQFSAIVSRREKRPLITPIGQRPPGARSDPLDFDSPR